MGDAVKDRAKMMKLIGAFTIELSLVDIGLPHLLAKMARIPFKLAHAIYYSQNSVAACREIVNATARVALKDPRHIERYRKISESHSHLFGRRNRLLHDVWLFGEKGFSLVKAKDVATSLKRARLRTH